MTDLARQNAALREALAPIWERIKATCIDDTTTGPHSEFVFVQASEVDRLQRALAAVPPAPEGEDTALLKALVENGWALAQKSDGTWNVWSSGDDRATLLAWDGPTYQEALRAALAGPNEKANLEQHTPGPWKWGNRLEEVEPDALDACELVAYGKEDERGMSAIIDILLLDDHFGVAPANARLIMAAPELLESLKAMISATRVVPVDWKCPEANDFADGALKAIEVANAIIAKVEGKV